MSRGLVASMLMLSACAAKPAVAPAAPRRPAHAVNAVVLVNGCAKLGPDNAKLAQAAINQLVDGCGSFTGGRIQFTATLLPGGAIQFAPRPGGNDSIPLCALTHPLTHRVHLQKACDLDVVLEEGSMDVPGSRP
jgi:hypothetical protein